MQTRIVLMAAIALASSAALAQTTPETTQPVEPAPVADATGEPAAAAEQPAMASLLQHPPDYSGDWRTRKYLTGDWGGSRSELARHGVFFDVDLTQWVQGNARGGKDTNSAFRYSGSADYTLRLDTARMGLWPGGLLTLHGETQIGQSINGKVGALGAPNYQALLPVPGDSGLTTLSEFYFAQALSEKFVLMAGKVDLSMGDTNVFAHDQRTQFSNTMFRVNPVLFSAAPYTAMAVGAIWLPTDWITISTFVNDNDPEGAARYTGFNTAFHGREWYSVAQEYAFKWKPFGLTGNQRFGWYYTTKDFVDFESDSRLPAPASRVGLGLLPRRLLPRWARALRIGNTVYSITNPDTQPDKWGIYYNFDQFLYTEEGDPEQGFGIFGRFGTSPSDVSLIEQFYSLGLGGKGSLPTRDGDSWGVGYYLANTGDNVEDLLGLHCEQGVELYYNIQVTPWMFITPDLQVIIDPGAGFRDRDTALIYGLRMQVKL